MSSAPFSPERCRFPVPWSGKRSEGALGVSLSQAVKIPQTTAKGDVLAAEILAAGGQAESADLDDLDETTVGAFVDGVVARAGRIDISFNLVASDHERTMTSATVNISCGALVDI